MSTATKNIAQEVRKNGAFYNRGRRHKSESFKRRIPNITTANKENAVKTFVTKLNETMPFIFSGCKFESEKQAIAMKILESFEDAVIDCNFEQGIAFPLFNGKLLARKVEAVYNPPINSGTINTGNKGTMRRAHFSLVLKGVDIEPNLGFVYSTKTENGKSTRSELAIPVTEIKTKTGERLFKVAESNPYFAVGTIINEKARKVK